MYPRLRTFPCKSADLPKLQQHVMPSHLRQHLVGKQGKAFIGGLLLTIGCCLFVLMLIGTLISTLFEQTSNLSEVVCGLPFGLLFVLLMRHGAAASFKHAQALAADIQAQKVESYRGRLQLTRQFDGMGSYEAHMWIAEHGGRTTKAQYNELIVWIDAEACVYLCPQSNVTAYVEILERAQPHA